jgi:hypothetical protein
LTNPIQISSGTASQHTTVFSFANTAAARTVTFQDADGTLAFVGDLAGYVQSVTGTANEIDVDNTNPANPILALSATLDAPGTLPFKPVPQSIKSLTITQWQRQRPQI